MIGNGTSKVRNSEHIEEERSASDNKALLLENRLKGNFVSKNVANLSKRNLNDAEISLLSEGLNFVPTCSNIDKAKLKMELEAFGGLRLKWHFRNENKNIYRDMFKPKSKFNPRNEDAVIELYLSSLEEKLIKVDVPKDKLNNLTNSERKALYDLKNDKSIVIKSPDKGSAVVVWGRKDYIKEAEKQLDDEELYEEVSNDAAPLLKTINGVIAKIRKRGDLKRDTLNYFIMKDPKFARFYLLPKIHKRLHNVPGRPVISNSGYYTKNISSFLDHHLQPLAQAVKSYIKDTNEFLKRLRSLPKLPDDIILCTMDVVGL